MLDGFKKLPKMQFFKEGGHAKVKKMCGGGSYKKGGEVCEDDIKQDKKMIKKAFKEHDKAEHDKSEPTEIKLKKGGRAKKDCGTVKKYKAGGEVMGVYKAKKDAEDDKMMNKAKEFKPKMIKEGGSVADEKKKPAGDKDTIKKIKPTGDKKAEAKSGAKEMPNKYKKGGEVKKFADGSSTGEPSNLQQAALLNALPGKMNELERMRMANRAKNAMKYLGPAQQSEFVNQGGMNQTSNIGAGDMGSAPGVNTMPGGQKRGGKVKKMAEGKSTGLKEVDSEENPGLAELPTNVRNKMGYKKRAGKAC
jgi:hypothetical protein